MDSPDSFTGHMAGDNNHHEAKPSKDYEDMRDSREFETLLPPESSYENTPHTLVELDDDGNPVGELPRAAPPPDRLLSRYISTSPVSPEPSGVPSWPPRTPEEEQICLGTDDPDGGYLEPNNHIYQEIKEVKRTVEVTPTGSRIFTVEEKTTRVPLLNRLTSRISRKPSDDGENIKCTCKRKTLMVLLLAVVLVVGGIVLAVVFLTRQKNEEPVAGTVPPAQFHFFFVTCYK